MAGRHSAAAPGRRRVALAALLVSSGLLLGALPALTGGVASASAPARLPALGKGYVVTGVPASGSLQVTGRAWGHRIGMSQVGAQYAAKRGVPASTILAHYYPGTSLRAVAARSLRSVYPATGSSASRPVIRVRIEANSGRTLVVTATSGLALWRADGRRLSLPRTSATPSRWRLVPVAATSPGKGMRLQYMPRGSSLWKATSVVLPAGSGFVGLRGTGVRIELPDRSTRTEPEAVVLTVWAKGQRRWIAVSRMDPETYLRAVVPAEIGAASASAALQAQAVAARTYAARLAQLMGRSRNWDVCATTACQYYPGIRTGSVAAGASRDKGRTYTRTDAAIRATRDKVLLYKGKLALAMFSASNGGYSASGGLPYLRAKADPWDAASGSQSSSWTATLPVSVLARLVPRGDRVTSVALGGRDGRGALGGVASRVVIDSVSRSGVAHRTTTTPQALRRLWAWPSASNGLRSNWFAFTSSRPGSSSSTSKPDLPLSYGDRSASVRQVQRAVGVTATGYYGPLTRSAVSRWQRAHGRDVTGVVDTYTWNALRLAPHVLTPTTVLVRPGARGRLVLAVQAKLGVTRSGWYGPVTTKAVASYQKRHGWKATGAVDVRLWNSLGLPHRG